MCPSRMGTLGPTNLPRQLSISELSYPGGRPDTLRNLMERHRFIISTQRQGQKIRKKKKKKTISLRPQNRLSLGHFAKELSYPQLSGRDQTPFISNGFRFHGSWSRGAQLHHQPDFTASRPAAHRAGNDEKYRFLLP